MVVLSLFDMGNRPNQYGSSDMLLLYHRRIRNSCDIGQVMEALTSRRVVFVCPYRFVGTSIADTLDSYPLAPANSELIDLEPR